MPTIKDVAKHAGVAISTASAAINRSAPVSEEIIAKVEEAVKAKVVAMTGRFPMYGYLG